MTATVSRRPAAPPPAEQSYGSAFPNSTKVYLPGPDGIRVPMREIALSGGEPPLRVYDTSGPEGHDVRGGLPGVRSGWITERGVERTERRKDGKTEGEERNGPSVRGARVVSSIRRPPGVPGTPG